MRWLKIASLVFVGLVLVIFALMGLLYATRGTPARSAYAFGDPMRLPAAGDASFLSSIALLTHTRLTGGHTVELLQNGDGTYPRLWHDLRSAQRSITLQLYYCKPGQLADSLKSILAERAQAGVRVLLLLDAFGAQDLTRGYRDSLVTAGVRLADFRPLRWYTLHKAQSRSHVRIVVVDEHVGYTGGFGLADEWLGNGRSEGQWRETNVRIAGAAVARLQAAFAIAWAEATGEVLTGRTYFGAATQHSDSSARQVAGLLYATPTMGSTPAERFLILSLASARNRIWVANSYFVPDDDLRRLLTSAARKGLDVRVLTAGRNTDIKIVRRASHAHYEELLRAGVRIFEYQPAMLHAKTMVIDGIWSTVGTMNFDNRSVAFNDESNILVRDSVFARSLEEHYLDDLRHAREFDLQSFTKRSFFSKLLDHAAAQITRLL